MNFADVLDIGAARAPAHEAISLGDRSLGAEELRERAARVSGLLAQAGVERGDKVAVLLHNALEYAEIAFGVMGAGAVLLPVNPRLAPPEMTYVLDHAEASVIFFGPGFAPVAAEILGDLPRVCDSYVVGDGDTAGIAATRYADALAQAPAAGAWVAMDDTDDCMIVYTSGTTGRPKGAVRSHGSALWGAANFTSTFGRYPYGGDRFLYAIPLASIGFLNVFAACLFAGMPVELMYRFEPGEALGLIETRAVTHTYFVPSMWRMVLAADAERSRDTRALLVGIWGGEPLDERLRERIIERFGMVLVGVFGTTEGALLSARPGDDEQRPRTSGRAAGYNVFRVVDESGGERPRGEVGELINRSPTTLTRYHRNAEATAEAVRDGWYHTGDLAYMDGDGYVFVVDRKREMLISGGQNVYPAEIERALCTHAAIAAAAVIGVPDERWGEAPLAFVVLAAPDAPPEDELAAHVRAQLAGYKVPRHWRFVEELPTNANGKVRKHLLREWAQDDS